jgi:hypothetical protein
MKDMMKEGRIKENFVRWRCMQKGEKEMKRVDLFIPSHDSPVVWLPAGVFPVTGPPARPENCIVWVPEGMSVRQNSDKKISPKASD